jgi:hypothetical protein
MNLSLPETKRDSIAKKLLQNHFAENVFPHPGQHKPRQGMEQQQRAT